MPTKLSSTGIQFPNGSVQTTSMANGATGPQGPTGSTGTQGLTGASGATGARGASGIMLDNVINITLKPNPDGASGATGSFAAISPGIMDSVYIDRSYTFNLLRLTASSNAGGLLGTLDIQKGTYMTGVFSTVASISVTSNPQESSLMGTSFNAGDVLRVYSRGIASSGNVTLSFLYNLS